MRKIFKLIKVIWVIIRKPYVLNEVLKYGDDYQKKIFKKHNLISGFPQVPITQLFKDFNVTVNPYAYLEGATLPIDIALLKALAIKYSVKNYLEIGTWRGESVANVASVVDKCFTINLPDEEIYKLYKDLNYVNSHRFFSKNISNITHIQANSHNFNFKSLNTQFDLIFIDGDHSYKSVAIDTRTAFDLINADKGIIVWHDYMINPEKVRWEVMAGILDSCPPEKINSLYHVSNTLCAVYIPQKLNARNFIPNELPTRSFEITIIGNDIPQNQ
jgi:predicted O-methyltransferase YrrM